MLDEIPALEVITAIDDPEFEDYVAQLLYSQGWSIIQRELDGYSLVDTLIEREGLRTVLVYTSTIAGFTSELLLHQESMGFTAISLDSVAGNLNPHLIMSAIRARVRSPQTTAATRPAIAKALERTVNKRRVIPVVGSSGSPGRTIFAQAIAEELALSWPVTLIDADFRNRSLTRTFRQGASSSYEFASLDPAVRPSGLPEVGEREISIVDLGVLPPLHDVVNDRRWQAEFLTTVLEESSHLLYICKSNESSISELQEFVNASPPLLRSLPTTFICIAQGGTKNDRQALARFDSLLAGSRKEVIQQRLLQNSFAIPLLTTPSRSKKEIARIALSLL